MLRALLKKYINVKNYENILNILTRKRTPTADFVIQEYKL